jgi:hypothetical protein
LIDGHSLKVFVGNMITFSVEKGPGRFTDIETIEYKSLADLLTAWRVD